MDMVSETIELLKNRGDLSLRQVADGAHVDFEWLRKFHKQAINDPGVRKVERVHNYLSGITDPTEAD